jgi:hypothetical protein
LIADDSRPDDRTLSRDPAVMAYVWPFLIYTLIAFVVSYILVEYGQKYLYDEVTKYAALKVAGGALIMGAMLTWFHPSFETMFTAKLHWTALIAIIWAVIFVLILQFQPLHGAVFALVAVLLLPGLATIAVEGVMTRRPDPSTVPRTTAKPIRKGAGIESKPVEAKPAP